MSDAADRHQAVEITDEVTAGLEAAAARAAAFYSAGRNTLVGSMSAAELAAWDGTDELALVSDPDGIELPDEVEHGKAA